ncbi:hypothetical protein [Streptomyces canus]|uniref:hypothetical protein n=1 Tax=Streptomyces canus TaxID=58343 RepID=UPI002255C9BD|nr:hypothetical protein [Streptomyces canus]MCX4854393.1 hypothetical protein [Streptomyces canus]
MDAFGGTEDNAHRVRLSAVWAERGTITRLTETTFGTGYDRALARGTTVLDSTAAAAGPAALRDQPGISELDAAEAMRRAWFVDGHSLSDAEVYRGVAGELGPDADAVTAAYRAPASRAKARADFRTLRRLRVLSYPALRLDTAHAPTRWGARPPEWLP